jgi:hypothetical protein
MENQVLPKFCVDSSGEKERGRTLGPMLAATSYHALDLPLAAEAAWSSPLNGYRASRVVIRTSAARHPERLADALAFRTAPPRIAPGAVRLRLLSP